MPLPSSTPSIRVMDIAGGHTKVLLVTQRSSDKSGNSSLKIFVLWSIPEPGGDRLIKPIT